MHSIEEFRSQANQYIRAFNDFSKKHHLNGVAAADHICFKCDSAETFERIRDLFESEKISDFSYQSFIASRRIACIQIINGFLTHLGIIRLLELSDKKPAKEQASEFDHIEIYPINISYEDLVDMLKKDGVTLEEEVRPHHTTHDAFIKDRFKVRLTREPLIQKIIRDEIIQKTR